jgi:hypothetical protein
MKETFTKVGNKESTKMAEAAWIALKRMASAVNKSPQLALSLSYDILGRFLEKRAIDGATPAVVGRGSKNS